MDRGGKYTCEVNHLQLPGTTGQELKVKRWMHHGRTDSHLLMVVVRKA